MDDQQLQDATRTKIRVVQDAWAAARKAVRETHDPEHLNRPQPGSWRDMWLAFAIAGSILLFVKLLFLR
jgi:hypothetical protein